MKRSRACMDMTPSPTGSRRAQRRLGGQAALIIQFVALVVDVPAGNLQGHEGPEEEAGEPHEALVPIEVRRPAFKVERLKIKNIE